MESTSITRAKNWIYANSSRATSRLKQKRRLLSTTCLPCRPAREGFRSSRTKAGHARLLSLPAAAGERFRSSQAKADQLPAREGFRSQQSTLNYQLLPKCHRKSLRSFAGAVSSDTRNVNRSTQRRPTPLCARERSSQRGKQRHIPDWIDRRPNGRKILADFN